MLRILVASALLCLSCTTWQPKGVAAPRLAPASSALSGPAPLGPASAMLRPAPIDPARFRLTPEPATVEDHVILRVYDWLRPPRYRAFRLDFPGADGRPARAHWLLPEGEGPHATVIVFPILGGSHVVSEAAAKVLARRGYAVLRVERRRLFPRTDAPQTEWDSVGLELPAERMRDALLDARRLLDWLETRPEVDPQRLAAAGVSIGGIMAATLMGVDERIRAGVFVMAGGGLPELLHDSEERPLVRFREVRFAESGDRDRDRFLARLRPHTEPFDPLTWAHRIERERVVLVSGRFDQVVPPERTEALWHALGQPRWHRYPGGHYQIAPFFWWALGRGADHLDEVLGAPPPRMADTEPERLRIE